MKSIMKMNKRGQGGGLVTGLVFGVASLIIGVIVAFVLVSTLTGAGLIAAGNDAELNATNNLVKNFSSGVSSIATKIPTILLVAAIVLIIGVLAVLVGVWQRMKMGGGQL
jgi:predicted RND superfamily exporter protein